MINPKIWGLMPAAGSGQRMQSSQPKQYLHLLGKPVIEHSIRALLSLTELQRVVVCVAPTDHTWPTLAIAAHPKLSHTAGGETRAQSVLNGMRALAEVADDHDWVLVHDAARPCLQANTLRRMMNELAEDGVGGILAIRANDTLKQTREDHRTSILGTLDRSAIWHAQTPQMFRFGLLNKALGDALRDDVEVTDESSAMEVAGHSVKLVVGDATNIKLTTPDDLAFAEFLLRE